MEQSSAQEAPVFRPFEERDFPQVAELFRQQWLADLPREEGRLHAQAILCNYLMDVDWGVVAEWRGMVLGASLVACGLKGDEDRRLWRSRREALLAEVGAGARFGREVGAVEQEEADFSRAYADAGSPDSTAEVKLLIVSSRSQGMGLGRKLLGRSADRVAELGRKGFFLVTDDTCDVAFYDHLGLERRRAVPCRAEAGIELYIYAKELGDAGRSASCQEDRANEAQVKGRFAPTPSGRMHLGNVFSALMAWLAARSAGGKLVLRIEDLDPRAQDPEVAKALMDDLAWLGLDWDEGPYFQSGRQDVYAEALARLTEAGLTYPCFCTRAELHAATAPHASDGTYLYAGTCRGLSAAEVARRSLERPPATRLMVPAADDAAGTIRWRDLAYGPQEEVLARECGDFLVRRSDGVYAYQLAVVVDDCLMGVNQVVRGRDLLGSSARQAYLAGLLGHEAPTYGHVPLLVAPEGRRLSKRDRDLDLGALRERGVAPGRIVGELAAAAGLAGAGEDAMPAELVDAFSWDKIAAHRGDIVVGGDFLARIVG